MSCSTMNYSQKVLTDLKNRYGTQPEFIQAATEILTGLQPVLDKHPEYQEQSLLERLVEPERIIMFRVPWVDDSGKVQPLDVKTGDRVLFSKWSGTEVTIDGEELLVVKEADIMGIIEGKKAKMAA